MKKFGINCPLRNKTFLLSFCKLHRDCLTGIGHGKMVLTNACIFYFFIAKSGTKTIAHLPIAEGLSFRSLDRRTIVNGEMKKKNI
jgi:hypothetical protein